MNKILAFFSYLPSTLVLTAAAALSAGLLAGGMLKVTAWNLLPLLLPLTGLIALIFSLARWLRRKRLDRVVVISAAAAILGIAPALTIFFPLAYPASLGRVSPAATVRLPANMPLKVIWGGDTLAINQHVRVPDQRWAYDFSVEPYLSGSSKLSDYGCFGIPVVAPAAGMVTSMRDGLEDLTPGVESADFSTASGNHVVIRLDQTGTYLEIAHLKKDSVAVQTGQNVKEGQLIGRCGNSGNTSEPHIHIHHQRQDPAVYPINWAEGLPLYFRDLDGPSMPNGGVQILNGVAIATGDTVVSHPLP